ncbi:MAG: tetratricopeptide repeat protein [Deltaproteobacteria bacterium]|nr:tetratricopeptide repeat protein [Deltaproteobacteria bacterium]
MTSWGDRRAGAVLCLCGSVVACFVPAETGKKMQDDIVALQNETRAAKAGIEAQRAELQEQMRRADLQIEQVAATLTELQRAAHNTDADFGVQMERLIKELQELRGTIELTEYRLQKLEGKVDGDGSLLARIAALEKRAGINSDSGRPPEGAVVIPPAEPKDKKELLEYAKRLANDGKTADARGVYRDVVKRWPDEPGTTDEAYYALGELYYTEKKYKNALAEYIKVAEKFGSGKLGDDALYKIGLCSMELGNLEDAQVFFSEIIKNRKKSSLYKNAQAKLEEVNHRLEQEKKGKKGDKDKGDKKGDDKKPDAKAKSKSK